MKIPTRKRQRGLRFNITPLIDIVFLLIIFFLVASHFVRSETLEAVELPDATQHEETENEAAKRLVVTITADRKLHVAGKVVDLQTVEQMIFAGRQDEQDNFEIHIRSDKTVPYRDIQPIMLACARAGVTSVKFAVIWERE
jgi:biopolymer transport protein ExbD